MTARMVEDSTTFLKEMQTQMDSISQESDTLSRLREQIGFLQKSNTCTSIHHTVVSLDHNNELMVNTLGLSVILCAFEDASMFYVYTNGYFGVKKMRIAQQALAFIQGTGLEITLKVYGIDYDPDVLRQTFFRVFHVKKT